MAPAMHDPAVAATIPARILAGAIDTALLGAVAAVLHFAADATTGGIGERVTGPTHCLAYLTAIAWLPGWIYFAVLDRGPRGATLGKRALGLVVTEVYGVPISAARALARATVKLLPWAVALAGLCYPSPILSDPGPLEIRPLLFASYALLGLWLASALMTLKKQSVHDLAAGTYVIRAPRA